jgi:hypothetical protein
MREDEVSPASRADLPAAITAPPGLPGLPSLEAIRGVEHVRRAIAAEAVRRAEFMELAAQRYDEARAQMMAAWEKASKELIAAAIKEAEERFAEDGKRKRRKAKRVPRGKPSADIGDGPEHEGPEQRSASCADIEPDAAASWADLDD